MFCGNYFSILVFTKSSLKIIRITDIESSICLALQNINIKHVDLKWRPEPRRVQG